MIGATLDAAERARVTFAPVRDYYDDVLWAEAVRRAVQEHVQDDAPVCLVGHEKDATSYYLNHFPQWQMVVAESAGPVDATNVRRIYFEAEDLDVSLGVLESTVPLAVRQFLKAWSMLPEYAALVAEHRYVEKYKAAWRAAPYAPIFSTVDAVVVSDGQVLLIRRAGFPGKGQWALPGGFVEQRERLLESAIRELIEETGLAVLPDTLAGCLVKVAVFDHPDRSQRGRTITHAHYFDLRAESLPSIEAADDAAEARWLPLDKLAQMEDQFYEDHFHILDHFLDLRGERQ